jgi:hypothetical protein
MKHTLLLLITLTTSCGIQQHLRHRGLQHERKHTESRHSDSLNLEAIRTRLYLNTANYQAIAELRPEGVFEYHPEQGFKGHAHRVIIRQSTQQVTLSRDSSKVQLQHLTHSATKEQEASKVRSHSINRKGAQLGWQITAASLSLLLFLLFLRYGQRR